jgi:hypothetical protein
MALLAERHVIVLLLAACAMLNYADRINASVAVIPMAKQFNWSLQQQSAFMSSFFLGCVLPGGCDHVTFHSCTALAPLPTCQIKC